MSLHMIKGYIAPDSGMTDSEVQTTIDDWVASRTKWSESPPTEVRRLQAGHLAQGTTYLSFGVRFTWDGADKDNTLQKASDKFKNKVDWFSLTYHVCDHDDDAKNDCTWEQRWDWSGTDILIPSDIKENLPPADDVTVVNP